MEELGAFLIYLLQLLGLTLGGVVACGFCAWLSTAAFARLSGGGKLLYVSGILGTPIHELGHAVMCPVFGHKITELKLLLPPGHSSGTMGYVSHSYNRKNPWARLGNLFIGLGPILSGLAVMLLCLFLCFPTAWEVYLDATAAAVRAEQPLEATVAAIFSPVLAMPSDFVGNWWAALIGTVVLLAVSQHVTLSASDIKGALSALPWYLLLLALFAIPTFLFGVHVHVVAFLVTLNLRLLSLFAVSISLSLVWLALSLVLFLIRRRR